MVRKYIIFFILIIACISTVSANDWLLVKKDQSLVVPYGRVKITVKPTTLKDVEISPKLNLTSPKDMSNTKYFDEITRHGWHPVSMTYLKDVRFGDPEWHRYCRWNGELTLIEYKPPFEYSCTLELYNIPMTGDVKLYLNDKEVATLYKYSAHSSHWWYKRSYRVIRACWKIEINVKPKGDDKFVAEVFVNNNKVASIDIDSREPCRLYIKAHTYNGWHWFEYLDWHVKLTNRKLIIYKFFEDAKVVLPKGYYLVVASSYPQIVDKNHLSKVLITKTTPFEYKARIGVVFVSWGEAHADIFVNNIHLATLRGWYSNYYSEKSGGWSIRFTVLPEDGKMIGKLYVNDKLVKTIDLTAFDKYSLKFAVYRYSGLYHHKLTINNIEVKSYKYLGNGSILKLDINMQKTIPIKGYTSAKVIAHPYILVKKCGWKRVCVWGVGSKCYWWSYRHVCWYERKYISNGKVVFEARNDDKRIDYIVNEGTLSLKGATSLVIKPYGCKAEVYIILSGKENKESEPRKVVITLPLTEKTINMVVSKEKTIEITKYLKREVLNPVIITTDAPIMVKVDIKPSEKTIKWSNEKIVITKAWHTFDRGDVGKHSITAKATNEYGLSSTDTVNVSVVNTGGSVDHPPVVKITRPKYDVVLPGEVQFVVTATDDKAVSLIKLYINGSLVAEDSYNSKMATLTYTTTLDVGKYVVKAEAYDNNFQKSETTLNLTVRHVNPPKIVKIIIHTSDRWGQSHEYNFENQPNGACMFGSSYTSGQDILVEAIVKKGDYDIAYVRFGSIDNLEDRRNIDPCYHNDHPPAYWWFAHPSYLYKPPYETMIHVAHPFGRYVGIEEQSITAMVCDVKGFCTWETVKIVGVEDDDTPPHVQILKPTNGETLKGVYTIKVHATDNRVVKEVYLWLINRDLLEIYRIGYAKRISGTDKDGIWTKNFDFSTIKDGEYKLEAVAYDNDGNSAMDSVTVYVKTVTIPTPTPEPTPTPSQSCVVFVKPSSSFDGCIFIGTPVTITFEATSNNCKLSKVEAYLDENNKIYEKRIIPNTYDFTDTIVIDTSKLKEGEHTVKIVAYSTTGVRNSAEVKFKLCSDITVKITGGNIITSGCIDLGKVNNLYFSYRAEAIGCKVKEVRAYLIYSGKNLTIYDRIFGDRTIVVDTITLFKKTLDYDQTYIVKVVATSTTGKTAYDSVEFKTCPKIVKIYKISLYRVRQQPFGPDWIIGVYNGEPYAFALVTDSPKQIEPFGDPYKSSQVEDAWHYAETHPTQKEYVGYYKFTEDQFNDGVIVFQKYCTYKVVNAPYPLPRATPKDYEFACSS